MKNEIVLRFGIWRFNDITHDEISRILGVTPSFVLIRGEPRNPKIPMPAKENGWLLEATSDTTTSFEEQMNILLKFFEEKKDVLKPLCEKYYSEISCAVFTYFGNEESTPWLHLDTRYNNLVKELNIEFDVDLYCMPNDPS
ncbi:DUF4279 domain-containing protein [Chitinophaga silvatica]|uniref:DUF4279 domain-containing protein n=1 Tax=Chitinophaga silvatica TaxID=2282649 RepID=A0A3E1Y2U6_9BACT|nr:DUF4279 domain-containing protein [Chitinophaga silvatica]RFS18995.1 DUF4279 domain-containing protein [Chitinophaga silvatica]